MLRLPNRAPSASTTALLARLQGGIDIAGSYGEQVEAARKAWSAKNSSKKKRAAFKSVKAILADMAIGPERCAYCEDSLGNQIEHIRPKSLFPDQTFVWNNYLLACGPCNGPKSNRYGIVSNGDITEFVRRRGDLVIPPPIGTDGLINPRVEDPLEFLAIDLGGVTPSGDRLMPTFDMLPADDLSADAEARALFTIDLLGLNREVIRAARENAFGGFRDRLFAYVAKKEAGGAQTELDHRRDDILATPHLTVFVEMRRQREFLPEIDDLMARAPEISAWSVVPP